MVAATRKFRRPNGRRRIVIALIVALFAIPVLAACGSSSSGKPAAAAGSATDLANVTLRVGDQNGTGLKALLTASGQLRDLPYAITWSTFTSGPPMMQALGAGAIDLGGVGDSPPIFAAASGTKIKLVAAYRSGPNASAILVPKGSDVTSVAQLKGKTVAVAKGSSANYHLLAAIGKAGLKITDLSPAYLQPAPALAALQAGRVDAWAVWEPYITTAKSLDGARVLANGAGTATGLSFQVASAKALTDPGRAAAIKDLIQRATRAREWALRNNDAWGAAWSKTIKVSPAVATASTKNQDVTPIPLDAKVIATEQAAADAFVAAGQIPAEVDISALVDTRFNAAVRAAG
ncbi:MAG: ABC transporter substrate-binding protein [Frankia sp.]